MAADSPEVFKMGLFKKKDKEFQHKELRCPRDGKVMDKLNHPSGAVLDICPKCGGMWLDREEVMALFNAKTKPKASKPKKKAAPKAAKR